MHLCVFLSQDQEHNQIWNSTFCCLLGLQWQRTGFSLPLCTNPVYWCFFSCCGKTLLTVSRHADRLRIPSVWKGWVASQTLRRNQHLSFSCSPEKCFFFKIFAFSKCVYLQCQKALCYPFCYHVLKLITQLKTVNKATQGTRHSFYSFTKQWSLIVRRMVPRVESCVNIQSSISSIIVSNQKCSVLIHFYRII